MEVPQCHEAVVLHSPMPPSLEVSIKSHILGHVLNKECSQKIREDASAAYVTMAQGKQEHEGDSSYAYVYVYCATNPQYKDLALQIINDEMEKACTNVDVTSVKEAQEYLLKAHATSLKDNGHWLNAIVEYLLYGIDDNEYEKIVLAQTPETIAAFARQLFNAGNRIEIIMSPEE